MTAGKISRRDFLRRTSMAAAGLAGASILSACTGITVQPVAQTQGQTEGGGEAPPMEPVTIRFHARIGAQEDSLYDLQMPKFMEAHPNITVVRESFPGEEFSAKVATMQAGGTLGDAVWSALGQAKIQFSYAQGIVAPIDELVESAKVDLSEWYAGCIDAITVEGNLLGLPFKAHPGIAVIYYNTTAFDEAGLEYPTAEWTLEEQIDLAKALNQVDGDQVTRFGYLPNVSWKGFVALSRAFGKELINEDGTKFLLNENPEIVELAYDYFHTHKVAPTPEQAVGLGGNANQMWSSGLLGMFQGGTSVSNLQNTIGDKFKWKAIGNALGSGGVGGSDYEVDAYCVTTATQHPNEAFEWVRYLCNEESGVLLGVIGGTVGGRPDVYNSPVLLKNDYRQVFKGLMDNAQASRITANWRQEEAENAFGQLTQPLWAGEAQPDQAFIDEVAAQIQDIMDKPRP